MTQRKRVEVALRGGHSDCVPFTMYSGSILPRCVTERLLRNRGMCIVERLGVFKVHRPNVKTTNNTYWEGDKKLIRTNYETPVGAVSTLVEDAGFTGWSHEKMFKTPDDYKVLAFMLADEQYEADYEPFAKAEKEMGEDAIFRAGIGLEPLQALISGDMLDMQEFCMQWMENRDEILKLYDIIVENRRKAYPIVAQSPALHANYGGNVVPEIIGLETFERYFVPHYNEMAEEMHKHGKIVGCHFDANCGPIAKAIGSTDLDYIEAFTPAPDTDMTLGEARKAWPGKVLWLNFMSSVHLKSDEEVEAATVALLEEISDIDGVIMGITENMPEDRWQSSCTAIMDGLERHATENPALYK